MFTSWPHSVIYQIYPRSFKDSNADGIGDLKGIIEKLPYLAELGVDALWISPFFTSPMKDFGYDISDYYSVDPIFGTLDDIDLLIKEAHTRNLKVMMDFVPNHTSNQHPWFLESASSKDNPKRDWYIWKDPKSIDNETNKPTPPNNWLSIFGGSVWEWHDQTKQYYLHTFLKEQPDLNWRNPEVVQAMLEVIRFWLKRGIDGLRVDAFIFVYKDQKFLDEPIKPESEWDRQRIFYNLNHIYTVNQPELLTLLDTFCDVLDEFGGKFMITETSGRLLTMEQLIQLYRSRREHVHAPFNFYFINLPWDANVYKTFIDEYDARVGNTSIPTFVLGNHDKPRVTSRIGKEAARTAAMLLLTLRGIPTIYYGEEIGMEDGDIRAEDAKDPHRTVVDGKLVSRDPERTPMQWNSETFAGFSETKPWLPLQKNVNIINVLTESSDPTSMLSLYKAILQLRKTHLPLTKGTYYSLPESNDNVLAYMRETENEKILVLLNFSGDIVSISLPVQKCELLLSTYLDKDKGVITTLTSFTLRPYEGIMFKIY